MSFDVYNMVLHCSNKISISMDVICPLFNVLYAQYLKVLTHKSFLFRIRFYTPEGPPKHV